ncbi:MAG: HAD family phosphatase [Candidatus Dadabacteria bacterium]|nr:HAD family phosphatase [Candidatus Dadabacteria bacterium]NIV42125.1 HAD-IA family hydrolase [Candidatus Dadabacteria bacterium]NIX15858.1 HAD-IA family hydrolase [Candidatus Dadabacteria bacterium]
MIKAVIFDMDGVMIDSEPLWEKTEKIMMARKGITYTPAYREKIVGLGQKDSAILLKNTFGLEDETEEIVNSRISILLDIYDKELELVSGLELLLDSLSKSPLQVALASSSPIRVINFVLDNFELSKYFDPVVSGDMVENGKPNPDIYLHTAGLMSLSPPECVVIEDSINGVVSAKAAGMYCIAVPDKRLEPNGFKKADVIIDDLEMVNLEALMNF